MYSSRAVVFLANPSMISNKGRCRMCSEPMYDVTSAVDGKLEDWMSTDSEQSVTAEARPLLYLAQTCQI